MTYARASAFKQMLKIGFLCDVSQFLKHDSNITPFKGMSV